MVRVPGLANFRLTGNSPVICQGLSDHRSHPAPLDSKIEGPFEYNKLQQQTGSGENSLFITSFIHLNAFRDARHWSQIWRLVYIWFLVLKFSSMGTKVGKYSASATQAVLFLFSTIQEYPMAKSFGAKLIRGNTIAIITAHLPGQHMWLSDAWVLTLGPIPSTPKQWKSDVCVRTSYLKPRQHEIATYKTWEKKL